LTVWKNRNKQGMRSYKSKDYFNPRNLATIKRAFTINLSNVPVPDRVVVCTDKNEVGVGMVTIGGKGETIIQ
jgi:hypothetical protein